MEKITLIVLISFLYATFFTLVGVWVSYSRIWKGIVALYGCIIKNLGSADAIGWLVCIDSKDKLETKNNTVRYYLLDDGLYVSPFIFSLIMRPVFIPWEDLEVGCFFRLYGLFDLAKLNIRGTQSCLGIPIELTKKSNWQGSIESDPIDS